MTQSITSSQTDLSLDVKPVSATPDPVDSTWIYVPVAPFPTVTDGITLKDLQKAWQGSPSSTFKNAPLLVSPATRQVLEKAWGAPAAGSIKELPESQLLDYAWANQPAWAIVPFEQLEPRWKALKLDDVSVLDKSFDPSAYGLSVHIGLTCLKKTSCETALQAAKSLNLPATNRDPSKMTIVALTGTTALVRHTALRMEENGLTYPGRDIQDWLASADITHISNEVAFAADCPPAKPLREGMHFCSDPRYIELFKSLNTKVFELTGNHELDWGPQAFLYTLDYYKQMGYPVYGGGKNQVEARKSVVLTDHGNRIAFLGCNVPGPDSDRATGTQPGAAKCDYNFIQSEIKRLKAEGDVVIFTFQHYEVEYLYPAMGQREDFHKIAGLGADIVSGSQAHSPQGMTFSGDTFIHYGLGNLFFDQMTEHNRPLFIDRHVIYDGRYISTELLTAEMEDYAKPRPMTPAERTPFLQSIFDACKWTN
jgi:poly-gamma-glutamate synthesis protein (capsule biosynthesis protein)